MPLTRKMYRGCKVWAEVDEQGRLVEQRGLVPIRYRQDATEKYSARVSELGEVPQSDPNPPPSKSPPPLLQEGDGSESPPRSKPRKRAPPRRPAAKTGEALIIYADGSCFGNPGPAGIGVLLEWKGRTKEVSRYLGEGTNNIAELTAIEVALEQVKDRGLPVRVHTDSAYSIGVLSGGWKAKENRELIARVQALMAEFPDLLLVKVRGHSGDPRNERVDQLARDAITRRA